MVSGQRREVSVVIAARTTQQVLPLYLAWAVEKHDETWLATVMPILRATAVASLAAVGPNDADLRLLFAAIAASPAAARVANAAAAAPDTAALVVPLLWPPQRL